MSRGLAILLALAIAALPAASAARAAEAQSPLFGFNEGYAQFEGELLRSAAADSRAAGATVARFPLAWGSVEPEPARFSWPRYDSLYYQLLADGIRPLPVIVDSPWWARPWRPRSPTAAASYPDRGFYPEWERFAAAVAQRYPESVAIEVWNEPNSARFWGGKPDPRGYVELLAAAHSAIKGVDPAMPVLVAGPAPRIGEGLQWDRFLRRVYEHGAAEASDGLAVHPYAIRGGPLVPQVIGQVRRATDLLGAWDPGTGVWVTEVGFSTHPRARNPVSEFRQAALLADLYRSLRDEGVVAVLVHRLRDADAPNPAERGYGVTRASGERKPAFCALVAQFSAQRLC